MLHQADLFGHNTDFFALIFGAFHPLRQGNDGLVTRLGALEAFRQGKQCLAERRFVLSG